MNHVDSSNTAEESCGSRFTVIYILDEGTVWKLRPTGDPAICAHRPGVVVWEGDGQTYLELTPQCVQELGNLPCNDGKLETNLRETEPARVSAPSTVIGHDSQHVRVDCETSLPIPTCECVRALGQSGVSVSQPSPNAFESTTSTTRLDNK